MSAPVARLDAGPFRYELKLEVVAALPREVEWQVRLHPAGFRAAYPARHVNNIYLDTPAFTDYRSNVDGVASRAKLRVRWYGAASGPIRGARLELKQREGVVGTKVSAGLPDFDLAADTGGAEVGALLSGLQPALLERARPRRPVLINRYRRRYFVSACGRVRLTLDDQLAYGRFRFHPEPLRVPNPHRLIVELKYPTELQALGSGHAAGLPWRVCRFSKYAQGIRWLY